MTEATYSLPVIDTIKTGWAKVKGSKSAFWAAIGLLFLIILAMGCMEGFLRWMGLPVVAGLLYIIMMFIQLILGWGILFMGIQRGADQPIRAGMLFYAFNVSLVLKIIGVIILRILIILPSYALLVLGVFLPHIWDNSSAGSLGLILQLAGMILTIYLAIRMSLSAGVVLTRLSNPVEAIKLSFKSTRSNAWSILGILVLNMLIIIIGAIPFGIGLIWVLPYIFITYGVIFQRLFTSRQTLLVA
ncbi:MAG: hypothetical protein ABI597_08765 [Gammaproteobacteria bacterium]